MNPYKVVSIPNNVSDLGHRYNLIEARKRLPKPTGGADATTGYSL